MQDILSSLQAMRRPELLIRAARIGARAYSRQTHLTRLIGIMPAPSSGAVLMQLIELEAEANDDRKNKQAGYSPARHVDILIAMMGEARMLQQARQDA
jgi:hypothetical protein